MSHITGGGLAANLERVLPVELDVDLDRTTWSLPPVFRLVAETGDVAREDLERTLNCGVGMVSLTAADGRRPRRRAAGRPRHRRLGRRERACGRTIRPRGRVTLHGDHPETASKSGWLSLRADVRESPPAG